jgi:cell shape-determining protein MreC
MDSMKNDELYSAAESLVSAKGHVNDEFKQEVIAEVIENLKDTINLEILSRMTKDQMDGFNELLNNSESSESQIMDYLKSCDIDFNNVTSVALTKFRISYLGA